MKSRFLGILSLLLLTLALTACNGSSGSDSSGSSSSGSASGAVSSIPLASAEVWGYNAEGVAIKIGDTLPNGAIKFDSAALSNVQFPNAVVFSKGGHSYINNSTADFAGTLKGVMASPSSSVYLTPANTLVAALVEEGIALDEAKSRVKKAVNVEMGVNIDPFANPLENVTESEIVAQTIFAVLGIREDAAGSLDEDMKAIANSMNGGKTFATAVKANVKTSPMNDAKYSTNSLFDVVKSITEAEIMPQVKEVLTSEDGSDTYFDSSVIETQEKAIKEAVEPNVPVAISLTKTSPSIPEFHAITGAKETFDFSFEVLSNKVDATGKPVPFDSTSKEGDIELVTFSGVGTLVENAPNVFTYTLNTDDYAVEDLPLEVTGVIRSTYDKTVTKTFTITLVDNTALVVEKVQFDFYDGKGLYAFDNTADNKIVDGSRHALIDEEFIAEVWLTNDVGNISENVDVRFVAPTGFNFEYDGANSDSYTVKNLTPDGGDEHLAKILTANDVKLVAVLDKGKTIEPGRQEIGMQVIDTKNNNAVLKTGSSSLVFVPAGMENDLTAASLESVDNKGLTITEKAPGKGEVFTKNISLAGSYKTWVKEGNPNVSSGGVTNLPGTVLLMSTSGEAVFDDGSGNAVDHIEINVTPAENFSFTSNVTNFKYIYGEANDDIKMVFMLDPSDTSKNIESSSVLKLRFEPKAP